MADKPHRVQLSRTKGWRMPENTVKVDRSTVWGNPFRVGETYLGTHGEKVIGDNATAATLFRDLVLRQNGFMGRTRRGRAWLSTGDIRRELGGKNLACWCRLPEPGQPDDCHAAVLLELANGGAVDGDVCGVPFEHKRAPNPTKKAMDAEEGRAR